MYDVIAAHTGQDREKIIADTDRDNFLNAHEAIAYGIIDKVVSSRVA